jgi:hypothetical protein
MIHIPTALFWFATLVVVVYGVTTSPLLSVPRIHLSLAHPLLEAFVYCPVCVGFWAGLVLEIPFGAFVVLPTDPLAAGIVGAALLHLITSGLPNFLPGAHEVEGPIIEDLREMRSKLKENP